MTIEDVLRSHALDEDGAGYLCICGDRLPLDGPRIPYSDHVADAIRAHLLSDQPIERVTGETT